MCVSVSPVPLQSGVMLLSLGWYRATNWGARTGLTAATTRVRKWAEAVVHCAPSQPTGGNWLLTPAVGAAGLALGSRGRLLIIHTSHQAYNSRHSALQCRQPLHLLRLAVCHIMHLQQARPKLSGCQPAVQVTRASWNFSEATSCTPAA